MSHSTRQILAYCAALLSAALASSVALGAMGPFWFLLFPFVFAVALAHAVFLGLPLFVFFLDIGRVNTLSAAACGFAVGAIPIALFTLQEKATRVVINGVVLVADGSRTQAGWISYFQSVLVDGFAGAAGGLVFWLVWKSIIGVSSDASS